MVSFTLVAFSFLTLCFLIFPVQATVKFNYDPENGLWRMPRGLRFFDQDPVHGTYHYGYDSGAYDVQHYNYKEEMRNDQGLVRGRYGYAISDRFFMAAHYFADHHGYRFFSRLIPIKAEAPTTTTPSTSTTKPPTKKGKNMNLKVVWVP